MEFANLLPDYAPSRSINLYKFSKLGLPIQHAKRNGKFELQVHLTNNYCIYFDKWELFTGLQPSDSHRQRINNPNIPNIYELSSLDATGRLAEFTVENTN